MPQPLNNTSGSGYKIRVEDVADESDYDCSDEFYLIGTDDYEDMSDTEEPSLEVTSPAMGDVAMAGDEYTVEWDYNDGMGSRVGRFAIDLYWDSGSGDCGTFYTTICDKPSIGCKDSSEFRTWYNLLLLLFHGVISPSSPPPLPISRCCFIVYVSNHRVLYKSEGLFFLTVRCGRTAWLRTILRYKTAP